MSKNRIPAILELAWADFKLKYQGSAFGLLWTLLKPFLMLLTLYVVFKYFLGVGIDNFHLYILFGIIVWNFFADCMKDTMMSLKSKSNILKSISIEPSLIIFSATLHSFLTFLINLVIFFIIYLFSGLSVHVFLLGMLPLSLFLFVFVYGASLILSYLYLRVDDMDHIWDVTTQLLFWMTPVVYSLERIPAWFERFYMLNPVSRYLVHGRSLFLYETVPELKQIVITVVITLAIIVVGLYVFRNQSRQFLERL